MSINVSGNLLSSTGFTSSGEIANTPNIVTDGLVLWYDAGNLASYNNSNTYYDCGYGCQYYGSNPGCTNCNTQIKDMSGYGNDGTFGGGISVSYSNIGGSMIFNGSSYYVSIPNILLGNGNIAWTVCAWVKTTTTVVDLGLGAVLTNSSGGPVYSMMGVNSGKIVYWTYNGGWNQRLGSVTVNNDVWHHLTWVNFTNNTMNMYVDGIVDATAVDSTSGNNNPVDRIGGSWIGYFNGSITTTMIYKEKSLSSSEVLQNFNADRSRFGI